MPSPEGPEKHPSSPSSTSTKKPGGFARVLALASFFSAAAGGCVQIEGPLPEPFPPDKPDAGAPTSPIDAGSDARCEQTPLPQVSINRNADNVPEVAIDGRILRVQFRVPPFNPCLAPLTVAAHATVITPDGYAQQRELRPAKQVDGPNPNEELISNLPDGTGAVAEVWLETTAPDGRKDRSLSVFFGSPF